MISKNGAHLPFSIVSHGGDPRRPELTESGQVGKRRGWQWPGGERGRLRPDTGMRTGTAQTWAQDQTEQQKSPRGFLTRGPLTGGLATETLSCLHFEACPVKHGLPPRRPVDQGGLGRSTWRD